MLHSGVALWCGQLLSACLVWKNGSTSKQHHLLRFRAWVSARRTSARKFTTCRPAYFANRGWKRRFSQRNECATHNGV